MLSKFFCADEYILSVSNKDDLKKVIFIPNICQTESSYFIKNLYIFKNKFYENLDKLEVTKLGIWTQKRKRRIKEGINQELMISESRGTRNLYRATEDVLSIYGIDGPWSQTCICSRYLLQRIVSSSIQILQLA